MPSSLPDPIPLLDLHALHQPLREELLAAVVRVIDSQRFILGEDVHQLEQEIAAYCRTPYAIACASGSDALYLALLALGVASGDTVLAPAFSFFATAGAISRAGARPVFIDIDPATFNMDPSRLAAALKSYPRAKAVIPVHLYGGCADMNPILELAAAHHCPVIEDAAQSIGAEYNHRRALSLGAVGCLSFFPTKNLGGFGDGGMLATSSEPLARKLAALRVHGAAADKYHHHWIGINSRLDSLQAAVLRVKLRHLDAWTQARQHNAALYHRFLKDAGLQLPHPAPYQTRHVFNQFVVRCRRRDDLRAYLAAHGVGTEIYYPVPLHLQPCYQDLGFREGDFPESERAAREVLALPIHPALTPEDIERVCRLIRSFDAAGRHEFGS